MENHAVLPGPHALWPTAAGCIGFLIILSYVFSEFIKPSTKGRRLPPGPKPKPLIGNVLDMPPGGADQGPHWTKHRELYGPISYMNVLGMNIVIINDLGVARDLLDKRSSKYSSRPVLPFIGELVGFNKTIVFAQPDSNHRASRKILHTQIGTLPSVLKWRNVFETEIRRYLLRVLEQPKEFKSHIRREASSVVLKMSYGYEANPHSRDPLVDMAEEVMDHFGVGARPGYWMVDIMPWLKHVPTWFPGAAWKKTALEWQNGVTEMVNVPYEFVRQQMSKDEAQPSITSETLLKLKSKPTAGDHALISWAVSTLYGAGVDTTTTQMESFYLAVLLHPEALQKAQEEIDRVVGNQRLPDDSDRPNLPYCEALFKEAFRWEPLGEILVPHATSEDDTYGEYFIPKGSMVIPNAYGMLRDPSRYVDPDDFKPERFLGEHPEMDPLEVVFGFGRRICPGQHQAKWHIWMLAIRTMACFDIKPVPGHPAQRKFSSAINRRPEPFQAEITVRSAEHEHLIRSIEHDDDARIAGEGDGDLLPAWNGH